MNERTHILITGATGFVGLHLTQHLLEKGFKVRAVGRQETFPISHPALDYYKMDILESAASLQPIMQGIHVVVHLAARVHHLKDRGMQSLALYQETNVKGTQRLAKAAISNEVKRFIYVSTIKVNGEKTFDMPLRADDQPRPKDSYSLSKLQAEQILQEESRRSGMEWVIIRPPLVYGPGVRGNFRRLLKLANLNLPLPLGAIRNRRSLVSVYNLSSFIECCLLHPNARGEVFLVSDNQDLSTSQLIRTLKRVKGKRSFLFPFPTRLLKFAGSMLGFRQEMDRMVDSLQLNIEKSSRLLNWQPPFKMESSLQALYEEEKNR